MKKLILSIVSVLVIIVLVSCSSGTKVNISVEQKNKVYAEEQSVNFGTVEYADRLMKKAYESRLTDRVTCYSTETSATYLKLIYEEEKKQTELLQKILDKN